MAGDAFFELRFTLGVTSLVCCSALETTASAMFVREPLYCYDFMLSDLWLRLTLLIFELCPAFLVDGPPFRVVDGYRGGSWA